MKQTKRLGMRIVYFSVLVFVMATIACNKNMPYQSTQGQSGKSQSDVHIFLTDDPSLVFDQVFLHVLKVEVKAEDNGQVENENEHESEIDHNDQQGDTAGGWIDLNIQPAVIDLLQFRNGLDTLLASGQFPTANAIRKIRLVLGNDNSVVFQGNTFPLLIKDNNNTVLIKLADDISPANLPNGLDLSLDFDAGRSIRFHNNQFEWQSAIRPFRKEKSGSIEGRVLPASAKALITATNGVDSATAMPDAEGEFRITGLKPGIYTVNFHANAGNFADTSINQVAVSTQEDTHLPTVTLHP